MLMFPPFTPTIAFLSIISPLPLPLFPLLHFSPPFTVPSDHNRIFRGRIRGKIFLSFQSCSPFEFYLNVNKPTEKENKNENIRGLIIKFEQCLHIRDCIYIILRVHHSFPSFSMARFKLLVRIRVDHFSRVSRVSGRSVIVKRLSILGEIVFGVYRKWVRRGWSSLAC